MIGGHRGGRVHPRRVHHAQPDLAGRKPRTDPGERRPDLPHEGLGRVRDGMADQAIRRLPVPHHRRATRRIAGDPRERCLDGVARDLEGRDLASRRRDGKQDREQGGAACRQARRRSWSFSGTERMRLPVAAKIAFSTAGAATMIVGSPTPPQKPPEGMTIVSTFGISAMRITL